MSLEDMIKTMAGDAKAASRGLRSLKREQKDDALLRMAEKLVAHRETIATENQKDLSAAKDADLSAAMLDRLTLNDEVIGAMADGLREVAALPDPVGAYSGMWKRPNGLLVGRVRIPLGVIGFIYESRPNVTVDAAALCLKAGNAVILKGGSEAIHSNMALGKLLTEALNETGIPEKAVQVILSAPGDNDVNIIIQADQRIYSRPFGGGDHLNGLFGNPCFIQGFRQQFT